MLEDGKLRTEVTAGEWLVGGGELSLPLLAANRKQAYLRVITNQSAPQVNQSTTEVHSPHLTPHP